MARSHWVDSRFSSSGRQEVGVIITLKVLYQQPQPSLQHGFSLFIDAYRSAMGLFRS